MDDSTIDINSLITTSDSINNVKYIIIYLLSFLLY